MKLKEQILADDIKNLKNIDKHFAEFENWFIENNLTFKLISDNDYPWLKKTFLDLPKLCQMEAIRDWLRKTKKIHIVLSEDFYYNGINHLVQVFEYNPVFKESKNKQVTDRSTGMYGDNHEYPKYSDALYKGLELALELLS